MKDLKQLGQALTKSEFSLSEPAWRSIAREAIKGIDSAGQPNNKKDLSDAAFVSIKAYYSTWSDTFIRRLSDVFAEEYLK